MTTNIVDLPRLNKRIPPPQVTQAIKDYWAKLGYTVKIWTEISSVTIPRRPIYHKDGTVTMSPETVIKAQVTRSDLINGLPKDWTGVRSPLEGSDV